LGPCAAPRELRDPRKDGYRAPLGLGAHSQRETTGEPSFLDWRLAGNKGIVKSVLGIETVTVSDKIKAAGEWTVRYREVEGSWA